MTGSKPLLAELLQHPADERQLDHHQIAFQIGKARARQLRGAIHVDHLARQLEMVARLEGEARRLADDPQLLVLGAARRARIGQVRQPRDERVEPLLGGRGLLGRAP